MSAALTSSEPDARARSLEDAAEGLVLRAEDPVLLDERGDAGLLLVEHAREVLLLDLELAQEVMADKGDDET